MTYDQQRAARAKNVNDFEKGFARFFWAAAAMGLLFAGALAVTCCCGVAVLVKATFTYLVS